MSSTGLRLMTSARASAVVDTGSPMLISACSGVSTSTETGTFLRSLSVVSALGAPGPARPLGPRSSDWRGPAFQPLGVYSS